MMEFKHTRGERIDLSEAPSISVGVTAGIRLSMEVSLRG